MNQLIVLFLLALAQVAHVNGECANACNGHGTCTSYDMCICYRNWMANDCSEFDDRELCGAASAAGAMHPVAVGVISRDARSAPDHHILTEPCLVALRRIAGGIVLLEHLASDDVVAVAVLRVEAVE